MAQEHENEENFFDESSCSNGRQLISGAYWPPTSTRMDQLDVGWGDFSHLTPIIARFYAPPSCQRSMINVEHKVFIDISFMQACISIWSSSEADINESNYNFKFLLLL